MYLLAIAAIGILVKGFLQRLTVYKQGLPLNRTDDLGGCIADFTDLLFDYVFLKGTFYKIFSITLDLAGLVSVVMLATPLVSGVPSVVSGPRSWG
jgi:hypothetical protein